MILADDDILFLQKSYQVVRLIQCKILRDNDILDTTVDLIKKSMLEITSVSSSA